MYSYEMNFVYHEHGEKKEALVKLRLCPECGLKLNYKKLKEREKEIRKQAKASNKARRRHQKKQKKGKDTKVKREKKSESDGGSNSSSSSPSSSSSSDAEESPVSSSAVHSSSVLTLLALLGHQYKCRHLTHAELTDCSREARAIRRV